MHHEVRSMPRSIGLEKIRIVTKIFGSSRGPGAYIAKGYGRPAFGTCPLSEQSITFASYCSIHPYMALYFSSTELDNKDLAFFWHLAATVEPALREGDVPDAQWGGFKVTAACNRDQKWIHSLNMVLVLDVLASGAHSWRQKARDPGCTLHDYARQYLGVPHSDRRVTAPR